MATKPAAKRNLKPQEPGAPVDEDQMPEQAADEQDVEAKIAEVPAPKGLTDELKEYIAAQVAEGVKAGVKAQRREDMLAKRAAKQAADKDLPSQKEAMVLAEESKRAVLSRDGYVVPTNPEDVRRAGNLAR